MDLRDQKPSDRVVILQDKRKYTQAEKSNTRLHMTVVESNESLGLFLSYPGHPDIIYCLCSENLVSNVNIKSMHTELKTSIN
jgi:hypothetical protein